MSATAEAGLAGILEKVTAMIKAKEAAAAEAGPAAVPGLAPDRAAPAPATGTPAFAATGLLSPASALSQQFLTIIRPLHHGPRRSSSAAYCEYAPSSRLAGRT